MSEGVTELQTPPGRELISGSEVKLISDCEAARLRENFFDYRRWMRPDMLQNWWTKEVADALQEFYDDLVAGKRPRLAIGSPPQHGKSMAAEDFIAWASGRNPNLKTIFASYAAELGVRTNLALQRTYVHPSYTAVFPKIMVGEHGWVCNSELIEFPGYSGSFRNTTVEGAINGMALDLGVIDDPVKGRAEANSRVSRERVWNWFCDDWGSRFSKDAGMICVMTRWHVDDLLGRFIERAGGDNIKVLNYPAIAEEEETYRLPGMALFPELKPKSFLLERKKMLTEASWQALYQQHPVIVGGGTIPIEKLRILPFFDKKSGIKRSVRYVDKAAVPEGRGAGAYTAMVLMHEMFDKTYVIGHVARGHWGALERETKIKALVDADCRLFSNYEVGLEQEPGSGGKESAESTVRNLAGKRVFVDKVTGSKEVRAEPFIAQAQNDNVRLVAGDWCLDFLSECEQWPVGSRKDQVDAAAGAFNRLASTSGYTLDPFQPGFVDLDKR